MCGLDGYKDAVVGSLSVEMKKRTTIGVELAAKVSRYFAMASWFLKEFSSRSCSYSWMSPLLDWTHRAHGQSCRFYGTWQIADKRFFARSFVFLVA